jgi:hypothetical protein
MKLGIFQALLVILLWSCFVNAQSGGAYQISQSVIAGGGGNTFGGDFSLEGTIGQNIAGTRSSGSGGFGAFSVQGGFWTSNPSAPTAARVAISGRIRSVGRIQMGRIRMTLTDLSTGSVRVAKPNTFGYYRFEGIEIGLYLVRPESRNYVFAPGEAVLNLMDSLTEFDFQAEHVQ